MLKAHSADRTFRWLIAGMLATTFAAILVSTLYPLASHNLWVSVMDSLLSVVLWLLRDVLGSLPPIVFALGILGIFSLMILALVLIVADWLRRAVA